MNSRARLYCLAVIATACVFLPFQHWQALTSMPRVDVLGVVFLAALAILSELLAVIAVVGRHQAASSIAFIPFFACVLLFPPPAALVSTIVASALTQLLVHKRPLLRAAFNTAQG